MMNKLYLDNLRTKLAQEGIKAEEVTTWKNGVECRGLRLTSAVGTSNVCPVVYYSESETMEEFMCRIYNAMASAPEIDVSKITDFQGYARDHLYLGVQRQTGDLQSGDILRRDFLCLEIIVRLYLDTGSDNYGTIRMTSSLAKSMGVTDDDIWNAAIENSRDQYRIQSMADIIGMDGCGEDMLYVLRSETIMEGASGIVFPALLNEFAEKLGESKLFLLPSSTQEMIVVREASS